MKLAFVTPWYGKNIPGGAELLTRQVVENLGNAGIPVEVLTTTIPDFYSDWGKNGLRAGVDTINGITVRRFPVKKRNKQAFDSVNAQLMQGLPISAQQEQIFVDEMIKVPALYDYIRSKRSDETLFIFIPYMFATTLHGAQIAPDRSLIIPCLHDEPYARLPTVQKVLSEACALLFNVAVEGTLTTQLIGNNPNQIRAVIGCGIDTDIEADGDRFRQKYNIHQSFLLSVGRREPGKNTPLLLDYWRRYQQTGTRASLPVPSAGKDDCDPLLVLVGPGDVNLTPSDTHIRDLGFIPIQDKYDAYAAADIFVQPSVHESFSFVLLENWLTATPALVHADCAVTRDHVVQANGGLYFADYAEFAATVDHLLDHPQTAQTLGKQGQQYVLENFKWETLIQKYRELIDLLG